MQGMRTVAEVRLSRPVRRSLWLSAGVCAGVAVGFALGLARPRIRTA